MWVYWRTGFVIGGLWLSPDLDTKSLALKRWGILKIIWLPYRKIIPHRSIFSHGPLIGTAIRISYIAIIMAFIVLFLNPFGLSSRFGDITSIKQIIQNSSKEIFACLIGIEASALLHLLQDGDPLPIEWRKRKD